MSSGGGRFDYDEALLAWLIRRFVSLRGLNQARLVAEKALSRPLGRPRKLAASGADNLLMVEAAYLFSNSRFLCDGADARYQGEIKTKNDAFERVAERFDKNPPQWWLDYLKGRASSKGGIVKRLERLIKRPEFAIYKEEFDEPRADPLSLLENK